MAASDTSKKQCVRIRYGTAAANLSPNFERETWAGNSAVRASSAHPRIRRAQQK
jgi:hypothetical protein